MPSKIFVILVGALLDELAFVASLDHSKDE